MHVRLDIYDVSGRHIDTVVNRMMTGGRHTFMWDGCDAMGLQAASGIYLYLLKAGKQVLTRKCVLLR
jgi:hypothetical protein